MSRNSKIGRVYRNEKFKDVEDSEILVEAAFRRGDSLSKTIVPRSPSPVKIRLKQWQDARYAALNAENPNMNPLFEVYDDIRIDSSLTSNIDTRIMRVQQSKFNWVDQNGKPVPEANKLFERQWFLDFQRHAMESQFEHFRLIEIYEIGENGELIECKAVNKYHVKPKLGIVTKEPNDEKGEDYLSGPISLYYIPVGDPDSLGILYKVAPHVLAKKYALGNWSEFNEKMGIPFRAVTTNAANAKRQEQLGEIMKEMGSAGWAVLNEGEKVELLAIAGTDPTKCFEGLINKLDSERAMLIMGQSSTSNSEKNKGTYGSMQMLQEISEDRHEADLVFIKYIINDKLKTRLAQISPAYKMLENLTFEWDKSVDLTVSEIVEYVATLEEHFEVDTEFITQKTGIPIIGRKAAPVPPKPPKPEPKKKSPVTSAKIRKEYKNTCCTDLHVHAETPLFEDSVLRVAKLIYDGKQKGAVDMQLLRKTAQHIREGLNKGFTAPADDQARQLQKVMERNVYVFSGFKTHQQLQEISGLLKGEDGKIRAWSDFKKEVLKVNAEQNGTWLKAEYDNAFVSGQQADQWLTIQKTKATLPLLRFVATNDQRTTQICKDLDGVTLPADDEFWDTHFLPLHWGERSLIAQVASGVITDLSTVKIPDLQPMFSNNVGKTGVVFPETHPYYKTSQAARKNVLEAVDKLYPDPADFKSVYKSKNGGYVQLHATHHKDEVKPNTAVAKILADKSHKIKLLDYANNRKNPDATINGVVADFKRMEERTSTSVQGRIRDTAKQKAEIAVISVLDDVNDAILYRGLFAALNDKSRNKAVKQVWFLFPDKTLVKVLRSELKTLKKIR